MRLTSDFWVKALIRRVFGAGEFAVVENQGSAEAGAIFIRIRGRNGLETLLGPAPQSLFDTTKPNERTFEIRLQNVVREDVESVLERERKFDTDCWIVELETDRPEDYVPVMPS